MEQANFSYIDALCDGDASFKQKLIEIVKDELPREIEIYEQNMVELKFQEAAENVHKLKHKISILGMEESYQVAVNYEENLKINSLDLRTSFELILSQMIQFITKI